MKNFNNDITTDINNNNINNISKLKNTVVDNKKSFSAFISNFNKIKKDDNEFYFYGDRRVDYNFLTGIALKDGIKDIPSKEVLDSLLS